MPTGSVRLERSLLLKVLAEQLRPGSGRAGAVAGAGGAVWMQVELAAGGAAAGPSRSAAWRAGLGSGVSLLFI